MRPSEIFQNIKLIISFVFCVLRMFVSTWGKALEVANKASSQFKVSFGVCVVPVVVSNVVVLSGEDIGGQMREMAIFGVPC